MTFQIVFPPVEAVEAHFAEVVADLGLPVDAQPARCADCHALCLLLNLGPVGDALCSSWGALTVREVNVF